MRRLIIAVLTFSVVISPVVIAINGCGGDSFRIAESSFGSLAL